MPENWTYGAELELSDWPRRAPLPRRLMTIDEKDVTMVNSDGVAVDPRGVLYHLGGEIQTVPTDTPAGQAEQLDEIMQQWPETSVNYRSNLHVHVRVPGLREDLRLLKLLQTRIHQHMPPLLAFIEPIPEPTAEQYPRDYELRGARERRTRRRVSHHKLLKPLRLKYQLRAKTAEDFLDREALDERTGQIHWAIHPRCCVNLRQLRETDTIEFRHFPGTTDPETLLSAVMWCRMFLREMLESSEPSLAGLLNLHKERAAQGYWPQFRPYDHWLESGYKMTSRKYNHPEKIPARIVEWLAKGERS